MYKAMKKIYSSPQATVILIDMRQNLLDGSLPLNGTYDPNKGFGQAGREFEFDEEYESEEVW